MKLKHYLIVALALSLLFTSVFTFTVSAADEKSSSEVNLKIYGNNLALEDAVYIVYAVPVEGTESVSSLKLLVWLDPQESYTYGTQEYAISPEPQTTIVNGVECYVFNFRELAAKHMTVDVYAKVYATDDNGAYYSKLDKYSVLQYCYNMLGKTSSSVPTAKMEKLLNDLLEYGASAQDYFEVKLDRLATDDYYQVKVKNSLLFDGTDSGLYLEGESVTLSAPASNAAGVPFAYWTDSQGNQIATTANFQLTVGNQNEVYTPVYEKVAESFTVTFVDHDGTLLKTETVEEGKSATAPAAPSRDGYTFIGWDQSFDNVTGNLTVTAQYSLNITEPTIIVSNATASAGETVTITVSVSNNPGVGGAKFSLFYDDSKLTLTEAVAEEGAFDVLDYTAPLALKNGCKFNWDTLDAESNVDGVFLTLTFAVLENASSGEKLNVNLSYKSGDIFDVNLDDVTFDVVNGFILVQ